MNQVILDKVEEIRERLSLILGTVRGNFSIEQQALRNQGRSAVLLKIYQQVDDQKQNIAFGLVIDKGFKIGYCHDNLLTHGGDPMLVKRLYEFNPSSFDDWICSFRPLRHMKMAA